MEKVNKRRHKSLKDIPIESPEYLVNKTITVNEYHTLSEGVIPMGMDKNWFIYEENNILNLHRGLSGNCIAKVKFQKSNGSYKMISIQINNDDNQFKSEGKEKDIQLIIDILNFSFDLNI